MTRWGWLGLVLVGAVAAASVLLANGSRNAYRPRFPIFAPTTLPAEEAAYYEAIASRLERATSDADGLVEIGEQRSRNLFAIRDAQERMNESLDALDLLLANRPPPDRFAASVASMRAGSMALREAMAEAQAAFLRLDWERVAAANDLAVTGADRLRGAERELDSAAGRPPSAGPGSPPKIDPTTRAGTDGGVRAMAVDVL